MGLQTFLQNHFPHRWLNPKKTGNIRLLGGIGQTLDYYYNFTKSLLNEMRINTAVDTIPLLESEFGVSSDPALSIEARRGNILVRKQERGGPLTKDNLTQAIKKAYGIDISIQHDFNNYVMTIQIENTLGKPDCLEQMQAYIEEACRAHVGKVFKLRYLRVKEIHNALTINQLQATPISHFQGGVN